MTTRTIQLMGNGFGSAPASIVATVNGNVVYSGEVSTLDQAAPIPPDVNYIGNLGVLCSFTALYENYTSYPVTLEAINDPIAFIATLSDYNWKWNPIYSRAEILILKDNSASLSTKVSIFQQVSQNSITPEDLAILENPAIPLDYFDLFNEKTVVLTKYAIQPVVYPKDAEFIQIYNSMEEIYTNIYLDEEPITIDRDPGSQGVWRFLINPGSVLSFELNVPPGVGA